MNWYKFSPVVLTVLIFLLAQTLGTALSFCTALLLFAETGTTAANSLNISALELTSAGPLPTTLMSLSLMGVNLIAVLGCHLFLHNIRLKSTIYVNPINWRATLLATSSYILCATSLSILTEGVELPDSMEQMSKAMAQNTWGLLALIVVGPISEELLFREAIEGEMLRRNASPWAAILASALAFSIIHLNLAQGLYALPLGILLGIIRYKTGNILLTTVLHMLNNATVALQLRATDSSLSDLSYRDLLGGEHTALAVMLLLAILSTVLTRVFWNSYPACTKQEKAEL